MDLGIARIDFYDPAGKVVHEIKKSNKKEPAHAAQVKYYIYLLGKIGIADVSGLLEYPALRETEAVTYDEDDEKEINIWLSEIECIVGGSCPAVLPKTKCKNCAYEDFCWSGEEEL